MKRIFLLCVLSASIASASDNYFSLKNLKAAYADLDKCNDLIDTLLNKKIDADLRRAIKNTLPAREQALQKTIKDLNAKIVEVKEYNNYCNNPANIDFDTKTILKNNLNADELL